MKRFEMCRTIIRARTGAPESRESVHGIASEVNASSTMSSSNSPEFLLNAARARAVEADEVVGDC